MPPLPLKPVGGTPLDGPLRAEMERVFAADFSDVRIHRGREADSLCALLGADACTNGSHVHMRGDGRWLIAHELTHVLQQRALPRDMDAVALEHEADRAADAVVRGDRVRIRPYPAAAPAAPVSGVVLQAHSSWEHRLLGDLSPDQMKKIALKDEDEDDELQARAGNKKDRKAVLELQEEYLKLAEEGAQRLTRRDMSAKLYCPDEYYPLQMPSGDKGKVAHQILVSYGELTTLGDYFQNPDSLEQLATHGWMVERVLQNVREESYQRLTKELNRGTGKKHFQDCIRHFRSRDSVWSSKIQEIMSLQAYTSEFLPVATNQYQALLLRNVCHFAPYTWYRWQQFHVMARDLAKRAHSENSKDPKMKKEMERRALLCAGYADHFLQDSFAAGHLIDKTLIMQWFIEWVASGVKVSVKSDFAKFGKIMTVEKQPRLALPPEELDRLSKEQMGENLVREPYWRDAQTALEQVHRQDRIKASGIQVGSLPLSEEDVYQSYLRFLQNMGAQLASNALHDHYCKKGLMVGSKTHARFKIFGDEHMIKSGTGMVYGCQASHRARKAITDLLKTGRTDVEVAQIFDLFPKYIHRGRERMGLGEWHANMVKPLTETIFGNFSLKRNIVAASLLPRQKGSISPDYAEGHFQGLSTDKGDYFRLGADEKILPAQPPRLSNLLVVMSGIDEARSTA
ncbi:DUF4157 domain-containing protein [Streptomyces sp. NPDC023327]|uniref:eCIS core domain-containing protein n=1 Tax=Streptomyces sp. NPDC023327 TaxID=3157088 RepID=UPI0033E12B52